MVDTFCVVSHPVLRDLFELRVGDRKAIADDFAGGSIALGLSTVSFDSLARILCMAVSTLF